MTYIQSVAFLVQIGDHITSTTDHLSVNLNMSAHSPPIPALPVARVLVPRRRMLREREERKRIRNMVKQMKERLAAAEKERLLANKEMRRRREDRLAAKQYHMISSWIRRGKG